VIAMLSVWNVGMRFASNLPRGPLSGYFDNFFGTFTSINIGKGIGELLKKNKLSLGADGRHTSSAGQ
jgi:hypothetical protein